MDVLLFTKIDDSVKSYEMPRCGTVNENNLAINFIVGLFIVEASDNEDRNDIDAIVLVKKLGLKVIASGSLVTYDPV